MDRNTSDYKADDPEFYRFWNPLRTRVAGYYLLRKQDAILESFRTLTTAGLDIAVAHIADVGCGDGGILRFLCELGAIPENVIGIDLGWGRVAKAKTRNPSINVVQADAATVPLNSSSFDVVIQSTLFSSLLSGAVRRQAAAEMIRLAKPQGYILWLDLYRVVPATDTLHAIERRELAELFPGWQMQLRRTYLRMDWLVKLIYLSPRLCPILDGLPVTSECLMGILHRST